MTERIKSYIRYIDELLDKDDKNIDFNKEIKKHLIQISFFQHERLIHLIVTITFAVLTLGTFFYALTVPGIAICILFLLLLILLIAYIKHYYLLENSVQYMYKQYDEMLKKINNK